MGEDKLMKLATSFIIVLLLACAVAYSQDGDKFVYADFEKMENGRPVTNSGGMVQIYTAQESTPVKFKVLRRPLRARPS